ncbi:MAG TPA: DUF4397 domain-containing protein [Puia sp.]|nr:DUF4397 domain-containing protein [Puia sp.]
MSFILFLPTGCSKTGATLTTSPVTYLSLINGSALSSNITVLLNDTAATVTAGIAPGQYSHKYGTVRPGTYDIKFEAATSDSLLTEIPNFAFDTLNFYTLMIYTVPQTGAVRSLSIQDDFSNLSSTLANFRFFNLCSTHPNVDLYLNSTVVQQSRTTADNASNNLLNGFQTTTPATYTITAKVAGTDSVIVSMGNVSLALGNAYTIFLSGVDGSASNPLLLNVLQASY